MVVEEDVLAYIPRWIFLFFQLLEECLFHQEMDLTY